MPDNAKLQSELLSLSSDSKRIVAKNRGHFVIIDRPDVVVDGIRQVVDALRTKTKVSGQVPLSHSGLVPTTKRVYYRAEPRIPSSQRLLLCAV